jgi:hypothetical protein
MQLIVKSTADTRPSMPMWKRSRRRSRFRSRFPGEKAVGHLSGPGWHTGRPALLRWNSAAGERAIDPGDKWRHDEFTGRAVSTTDAQARSYRQSARLDTPFHIRMTRYPVAAAPIQAPERCQRAAPRLGVDISAAGRPSFHPDRSILGYRREVSIFAREFGAAPHPLMISLSR